MSIDERRVLEPEREAPMPRPGAPVRMRRARPIFSYGLIAVCVGMALLDPTGTLKALGLLYGPAVSDGQYWRVLTVVLLHGGMLHLLLNMSVVWTLGQSLEQVIGAWRMALVSVATALGGSALVMLFNYKQPTVGASGMILGYAGVMLPIATTHGRRALGTWLVQIAILSLLPGISWAGHLGGFLFGLPSGVGLRLRRGLFVPLTALSILISVGIISAVASGVLSPIQVPTLFEIPNLFGR